MLIEENHIAPAPDPKNVARKNRHRETRSMKRIALLLFAWPTLAAPDDVASLEAEQAANRDRLAVVQRERADRWKELLAGPLKEAGGPADETALRLADTSKRLDAEGRAKAEALKTEKDPDEIAALKIEIGQLRQQRDATDRAYTARVKALASKPARGAELVARVDQLDAEITQLQAVWSNRRRLIGEKLRAAEPITPCPKSPTILDLGLPEPADAATRRRQFAERNTTAELEQLAHAFFRLIDPQVKGVERACSLYAERKFAEALAAYRDYFFAKVASPASFGIAEESFTDDSRQFMSLRHPPAAWIVDAMNGIANTTSHDLGNDYVLRVAVGPPGAVNWAYVADQPALKNGRLVWLEFQRRLLRAVGNDGGYEGLRDTLLDAYILSGDAKFLDRWADYTDDWYLNAQRATDASPHNLRWADPIIPRLVCGFVSRLRLAALQQPAIAQQMPPASLARILIRLQEEYLSPNILVARTTRQNWNMMGLNFNVRNALLLPEFKPAQWAGREAKRGIDNAYLFSILPDGGVIEYGDEGHQGVWRERVGDLLQLFGKQRPDWATPEWQGELLDTFNQNVRFWIRHLKPDGYQHRDGLRSAREVYVGGVQSVYGPQSLDTQAPWVCAEPEAKRMLDAVFGTGANEKPKHLSDVSPFIGEIILRGAWDSNAPFFYMHAGRMPNSGCFDDATAFRVHDFGQNLLLASPLTVDGRWQNAHFGMVDNVGSKSEYLACNDGQLSLGRWHSSSHFDFAEGFYAGAYENKTGRQYRTTFQPGGNSLRLKNLGEPAVTNVRVAREVFFVRDPACWIVVDRIASPAPHTYRQSYDLFTPVAKLDWHRRAKTPIPNATNRVVFDETARMIRTDNPGFPDVVLHHFSSSPLRYEFDRDGHELDKKTKSEIAAAEEEWSKNRPELLNVMAFSRRVNVQLSAEAEATLVTLIAPMTQRQAVVSITKREAAGFEATFADGCSVHYENGAVRVRRANGSGFDTRTVTVQPPIQPVRIGPPRSVFTGHVDVAMSCASPGMEIRYTLDGSDPTPQSSLYKAPFRLENSARVKAIALRPGLQEIPWQLEPGLVTIPTWAVFTKQALWTDRPPAALQPGLAWDYLEGNQFALVANSPWWPAKRRGTTTNLLDVSMRGTQGVFGVRYAGVVVVPADGVYTFHAPREFVMPDIEAGYDLRVFVDGREWEPALRWHALGDWSVALKKGAHDFAVLFVDTRSRPLKYETWRDWPNPAVLWTGEAPVLEVSGPGLPRGPLPARWLFHAAVK